MTKILIKQSVAGVKFSYKDGDIVELEDELASAWVESGIGVRVLKEKIKAEFAVAKKVETPEAPKVEVPKVEAPKVVAEETKKGE